MHSRSLATILILGSVLSVPDSWAEDPFGGKRAQLFSKTYQVPEDFVSRLDKEHSDPFADAQAKPHLMNSLRSAGISFPKGGKAVYEEKDSRLVVRTTPDEMTKMDALVKKHGGGKAPKTRRPPKSPTERKLAAIVIPKVKFEQQPLKECVAYLNTEIKKHDPNKTGVLIKLEGNQTKQTINLDVTDVSAAEALRFTAELAGLKVKTRGKIAIISP